MIDNLKPAKLVVTLTVVTPDESYSSNESFFKSLNLVESKLLVKQIKDLLGNDEDELETVGEGLFDAETESFLVFKNNSQSFDF
ncbi:MAG: hypothetical protein HC907_14940 [Richelia sp. SM1_7_0]|nr:hypothetical protein [Richelia sp. SM1_7_0]